MTIIVIILLIAIILWLSNKKNDIDKEEQVALKTPGRANRLRENYGSLIDAIANNPDNTIIFERAYDESIRFGNSHRQELFISYSALGSHGPEIHVSCIEKSMVLMQWTFDKRRSINDIYNEITDYFK